MGIATWIGVAIGAGTLIAAGLAAKYAKEAADHTADGARAARATADLAERSISELERPFLVFLPQPIANSGETTSPLAYSFANYGRTPCVILNAEVRYLHITPLNAPDRLKPNFLQLALAPDRIVVPPGAGPGAANSVRLGKPVVEDAERAGMRMVHGYALYRATSGRIYICGFGLYWSGEADGWRTVAGAYNYDDEVKPGWKPPDPVTMTIKVVPDDNQDQST